VKNTEIHIPPKHLVYHLTHNDIHLGYFNFIQRRLNSLRSGDSLVINEKSLVNSDGEEIVKFSKSFQEVVGSLETQGYILSEAKIRFILMWDYKDESDENEKEIKIILPELIFEKLKN
jgi:ATP-dependent DNA helicase RecQ